MKISPGYNVKLCKAANYGECLSQIFTTDVANFVDIDFNDTLSSVEITYGGAGCGDTICSPPQENANNCPADCGGSVPGSQPMPKGHLNLTYPSFLNLDLNMPLNQLIAQLYYFIIAISGLAVFVMLVWGGFEYLTSTGNPSKIGNAKERITSALLGLLIILASYLILQVINPDLLTLTLPQIQH
ncbi:MAG: hypothetical protein A2175_01455 [Candidatus Nealsonbacteria bacterium RBG_13_42_11]|uniref:Uncharacterized protein n=1 Tax=Candidatus Nealsonbacteria bacterium RBG_13_42_11 TaxID=1801663 RepID=A0A1G2DZI3_9BACT|nr:MAG: hypothetical protein A2175_01455 [Candidatus Nealsonbacteria bacterium RBG_13_42_11]